MPKNIREGTGIRSHNTQWQVIQLYNTMKHSSQRSVPANYEINNVFQNKFLKYTLMYVPFKSNMAVICRICWLLTTMHSW
jgi:hypothetical protein